MIDSYGHLWQEFYDVMVVFHLWPAFPILFATMLIVGLAIWFVERLFHMGGSGE